MDCITDKHLWAFLDNNPEGVIAARSDGTIIHANQAACALFGLTEGSMRRRGAYRLLSLDPATESQLESVIADMGTYMGELVCVRGDGTVFPAAVSLVTVDGDMVLATVRDVSAQRHTDEQLRQRVEELETLMRMAPIALCVSKDPEGHVITGNDLANRLMEAVEGENLSVYRQGVGGRRYFRNGEPIGASEMPMQMAMTANRAVYGYDLEAETPSGCRVSMVCSASPLRTADGKVRGSISASVDITEWKRTEEENGRLLGDMTKHVAELETILFNLPSAVFVYGADGGITRCNPAGEELLAYIAKDKGLTVRERASQMGIRFEDGSDVALHDVPALRALRGETVSNVLVRVSRADGTHRWYRTSAAPIRLPDGSITGAISTISDVTGMMDLQEERRLLLNKKDEFLAICAHEMRTPLTVMQAGFELLVRHYDRMAPDVRERHMGVLHSNVQRLGVLVSDLLDWSRLQTGHLSLSKEPLDLAQLVSDTLAAFGRSCATHTMVQRFDSFSALTVPGDANRLTQVLNNLLTNAVKFSDEGSTVTVSLHADGDYAVVSVKDRGRGIGPEDMARLFDRYYRTTHANHTSGMGLGLYISSEIIRLHDGGIGVESKVGEGSTFSVRLPLLGAAKDCGA